MDTKNDKQTPERDERAADSALSASPGSAGIEPRDYEVYKETGVSWEGGKAHHFFSLACRCLTRLVSPLRVDVEGDELVIRIGLERITGNDDHEDIPALPITDPHTWGREICRELDRDRGDGATPISLLFDQMILNAIDNGACGIDLKRLREIQANS